MREGRPGRSGICPEPLIPPRLNPEVCDSVSGVKNDDGVSSEEHHEPNHEDDKSTSVQQPLAEKRVNERSIWASRTGSGLWRASSRSGSLSQRYRGTVDVLEENAFSPLLPVSDETSEGAALNREPLFSPASRFKGLYYKTLAVIRR